MFKGKVAVVIPAFKVVNQIKNVILSIPDTIDHIIVVDDKCPYDSGNIAEKLNKENVLVVYHEHNQGVGKAVTTGYKKALELDCEIIIKVDGDGQMDPGFIDSLIEPLISNEADYTKGNRFRDFQQLKTMPKIRLFGNSVLSFLIKLSSGYWNITDPTNGYTAIHKRVLDKLNLEKVSKRYFFESDMLIKLNILNAVVKEINTPAQYADEKSSLKIKNVLMQFPFSLMRGFIRRIIFKYFVYDFNMASVYILLGLPLLIFGISFGTKNWIHSFITGNATPLGTIMLTVLPVIISLEMILQAINIDINSVPKKTD